MMGDEPGRRRHAGLAVLAVVALFLCWINFEDWNTAPEVPMAAGLGAISVGRIAAVSAVLLLAAGMLATLAGRSLMAVIGGSTILFAALLACAAAVATWLEATGTLRATVLQVFGRVPGGPTSLQVHQRAIVQMADSGRASFGAPRPLEFFVGAWRRIDRVYFHDARRLSVREEGGRVLMRAWTECREEAPPCDAGEAEGRVERAADGRVQSVSASLATPTGRLWLMLAPGRDEKGPAVLMTHAQLANDPAVQVSSGGAVTAFREGVPSSPDAFAGTWLAAPGARSPLLQRLEVRRSGADLFVRAWAPCPGRPSCDLGEKAAHAEPEPGGAMRAVVAVFERENMRWRVTLGIQADGSLEAVAYASTFSYTTVQPRRGGAPYQMATGSRNATSRVILERVGR